MLPKKIHVVWVGDETRRPEALIKTWQTLNPDFEVRVWGNKDLSELKWINFRHMKDMWHQELCGVADLMRYEILYEHGGIAVDADSACLRPIEDWILEPSDFASWSNELTLPGMETNAFMGSTSGSEFIGKIIENLANEPTVVDRRAWQSTGPILVTKTWQETGHPLTIWPSHLFTPRHHSGWIYTGTGPVFGHQMFASTQSTWSSAVNLKEVNEETLSTAFGEK
ncbi:glycosyltransferase family 32 protein [Dermatophilus congolensis]|uniref:glycosyltransferase family 32 protein n=1 Tax=Dermatophilus congolensis TaxID=1863 RepID=UPI001AB04041|nr:glycosyltransferase [Dermatophilus congolensis]MBO3147915.1 hypothetical protein [Dermatophilus congolensis]